jgi:hypothetical protein
MFNTSEFMSKPPDIKKNRAGGARPGAGRPKGKKNASTLAREAALKDALAEMLRELSPAEIRTIEPLSVMLFAMRAMLAKGDVVTAASIARNAADFCHSKVSASTTPSPLPDDLAPDPEPQPDEPGPENPIL